jgi:hypothetical protein
MQDRLQPWAPKLPGVAGDLPSYREHASGPRESIRHPGYGYEHMFPFRPSRAAAALLELAEAMLAPDAFEARSGETAESDPREADTSGHPHRRNAAIERRRRPEPPKPQQACLTPLTRAGRAREAQRA